MSHPVRRPRENQLPLFDPRAAGSPVATDWTVRVVARSRRLSVRVYPGGRVAITVPPGTPPLTVERFVSRHRAWIDARVAEFRLRASEQSSAAPDTIRLHAFDEDWQVSYVERARAGWHVQFPGHLEIRGRLADSARVHETLRSWLIDEGERRLGPWLSRVARERGFSFQRCQIRRQRTRWGSCARSGTISLNVCLLFQPADVVHYLFVHELCHTRHMNHSARFWNLVEAHEPDWRKLDRALLKGWQQVPGWVYD